MLLNKGYSQVDVLTKASITIQIIEDVAIYKAQIFSSNGNILSIGDKSTDISLVIWKGLDNITNKFKDIIWKRFTFNSNHYEEDLTWGEEYKNKTNFTLTKDDIKNRAKIQAEVYGVINGERQLVAVDYINFIDVNDLQGSTTPPENPKDGDLWLDTSVTPPRLMMWDSSLGMWIEVTVAGKDRRNLIRNSNFYKATFDFWKNEGIPILEIESFMSKKWARIKSNTNNNTYCGIKQVIDAVPKSSYSFQMLSKVYIQSANPEGNTIVAFYSIDENNNKTLLQEKLFDITTDSKVWTTTFDSLANTKKIETIISGEENNAFDFVVTNIKLENYKIPTAWEIAIEDIQDALDNKVGNTHEDVFNSLTDNGKMEGMYVDVDEHGKKNFYFNATYIKTGKLLGEYIDAKNLTVTHDNGDKTLNINSKGEIEIKAKKIQIAVNSSDSNTEYEDAAGVSDIAWKIEIESSNGILFKNNIINTLLEARVYRGKADVTNEINEKRFIWTRKSNSTEEDLVWNETKGKGVKNINIDHRDVYQKATFTCRVEE